jgi:hypothetical protein
LGVAGSGGLWKFNQIESKTVGGVCSGARLRTVRSNCGQLLLNAQVALGDLLLHLPVVVQSLVDHEEHFGAIFACQRRLDLCLAFLDPMIGQRAKFLRIAFTAKKASKIASPLCPLISVST